MTFDEIPRLKCTLYGWHEIGDCEAKLPAEWNVVAIDWRNKSVELSNGAVAIFPRLSDYRMDFHL